MKKLCFVALWFTFLTGHLNASDCELNNIYTQKGWRVHDVAEFDKYLNFYTFYIKQGINSGQIVQDLTGNMVTNNTLDRRDMLMRVVSWDNLLSDKALMYGDYVIFKSQSEEQLFLELRWFDGVIRHIVYNGNVLACVSIIPPTATNTIF